MKIKQIELQDGQTLTVEHIKSKIIEKLSPATGGDIDPAFNTISVEQDGDEVRVRAEINFTEKNNFYRMPDIVKNARFNGDYDIKVSVKAEELGIESEE